MRCNKTPPNQTIGNKYYVAGIWSKLLKFRQNQTSENINVLTNEALMQAHTKGLIPSTRRGDQVSSCQLTLLVKNT